jgi:ABC-type dipeptide/oligopeptide/nickel transport system ATPase component
MSVAELILSVRHLVTGFASDEGSGEVRAVVDDVSFDVARGQVVALVGQSSCGKTLTALSILRLLPPEAHWLGGQVVFAGRDLLGLSETEMRAVRGRGISMIFQEPATALSPVHTVGWQLCTALAATGMLPRGRFGRRRQETRTRACELLARVELPEPERILDTFPHQLSAGMRRRVLIALALAGNPELLIADEPTTGLDSTIQSQILELLARLVRDSGMSTLLITHDLSAVAELASDVVVMYAGHVVEAAPVTSLFERPQHPYTRLLLEGARELASPARVGAPARFALRAYEPTPGPCCRFIEGCPERAAAPGRFPRCSLAMPELEPSGARHRSRCFYPRLDPSSDPDPSTAA